MMCKIQKQDGTRWIVSLFFKGPHFKATVCVEQQEFLLHIASTILACVKYENQLKEIIS